MPAYVESLRRAVRAPAELLRRLGLDRGETGRARLAAAEKAGADFRLLVPESFLARMRYGDPDDPLLRQVLPVGEELVASEEFIADPVGDGAKRAAPGVIHKYSGRVLLIATGACAVHCRYCFRRHYPYADEPGAIDSWRPAVEYVAGDDSIGEVILSGGDPLMLTDGRLAELLAAFDAIDHVSRIRIHTRMPIVLPDRVTDELINLLTGLRAKPVVVVHANHPAEVVGDCAEALSRLASAPVTTLNQAVLLRGVNDSVEALAALSERLFAVGVVPYYLHQLDRVAGATHFEVPEAEGRRLVEGLRGRLPGYLVPKFVREEAGEPAKTPLA